MNFLDIADEAINDYGAMQKRTELAGLLALARASAPRTVWEIGTASGGTLWAIARALRYTGNAPRFASIDLPGGPFSGGAKIEPGDLRNLIAHALAGSGEIVKLQVCHGDSRTVELPRETPDLLVIDGDHSEEGVRADWGRYGNLVNEGGLICFHDILPHSPGSGVEVDRLWAEIHMSAWPTIEIIDTSTYDTRPGREWGGIGVVFR